MNFDSTSRSVPGVGEEVLGLPIDPAVMFSDYKGEYKQRIEKAQKKLLEKIRFIKPFLKEDEKILLVTTGCSKMGLLELFTLGWITAYLKQSLFVLTNKRIFHVPTKYGYSYRNSIAQILYNDCQSIKQSGSKLVPTYKNGEKEKFLYIRRADRKRIRALLEKVSFDAPPSKAARKIHLCPRCTGGLEHENYVCPSCKLEFKNKAKGRLISLLAPGGGYFYTGHPFLGLSDAIVETILIVLAVVALIEVVQGQQAAAPTLVLVLIILAFEKLLSVYHANKFIEEYIPVERNIKPIDKTGLPQPVVPV